MDLGDRADHFSYMIRDRAGTAAFDAVLGVTVVKIPLRCPRATRSRSALCSPPKASSPTGC